MQNQFASDDVIDNETDFDVDGGDDVSDEYLNYEGWQDRATYMGTRAFDMIIGAPNPNRRLRVNNLTKTSKAAEGWRRITSGEVSVDQEIAGRQDVDTTHTMLHIALEYAPLHVVKKLLDLGADVNIECTCSATTVVVAMRATEQRAEKLELVLRAGASIHDKDVCNKTSLMCACDDEPSSDTFKCFRMLMQQQGATELINEVDDNGYTALHFCMYYPSPKYAKILIDNGADIHLVTNDGFTPLALATQHGSPNLIKYMQSL